MYLIVKVFPPPPPPRPIIKRNVHNEILLKSYLYINLQIVSLITTSYTHTPSFVGTEGAEIFFLFHFSNEIFSFKKMSTPAGDYAARNRGGVDAEIFFLKFVFI